MMIALKPTMRPAGEFVKAFREYLAVHPNACTVMDGLAKDDMALDLARIALNFQASPVLDDALTPAEGEVLVLVSGFTGSGKSAVAGEIEIMCRALGLQVEWPDGAEEKGLTGADWQTALEMYKPRVRIVEKNVRAPAAEPQAAP